MKQKQMSVYARSVLCLATCLSLGACAELNTAPHWDRTFGTTLPKLTALQTLQPQGAQPADVALGVDGETVIGAQNNYVQSYLSPQGPSRPSMGVSQ